MNTYVKTILTCVMCSIFLLVHTQDFKADDFETYPSDFIGFTHYFSVNGGAMVQGDTVSTIYDSLRTQCVFTLEGVPLSGNSIITLSFDYFCTKEFFELDVLGVFLYDEDFNSLKFISGSNSSISYETNDDLRYNFKLSAISVDRERVEKVKYIYFIFNTRGKFPATYSVDNIILNYSTPDIMEDVVNPKPEDQENVNNSNSEMNDNKNEMDSMINDMNSVPEPNVDDLTANLDKYLPQEHITTFSSVLSALFQNEIVIAYVMIGLVVALVSFVLFGKKG